MNKYCSFSCQQTYAYKTAIDAWKLDPTRGNCKSGATNPVKRYIFEKQDGKCLLCGIKDWNDKPIKLELDHVDGNHQNNTEENLRYICPNCHSQTDTYKAKNKGNGRKYRQKYN